MPYSTDEILTTKPQPPLARAAGPPCPVDRMPSRRRNKYCILVILVGACNFLAFTLTYAILGGDAHNGAATWVEQPDGTYQPVFHLRGHFIHSLTGKERVVDRGVWIYSYLHSITLPLTSGAMIISMLILARPHILATMRDAWIGGQTFVIAFGTIVVSLSLVITAVFTWDFLTQLRAPT